MHANHREDKDAVFTGDIVAAVGLKNTTTGDTLCDPAHPIVLEALEFPEPVIHVAVEPKTKADQDKLRGAVRAVARRTRRSACAPTRRRARPSSRAWASSTSRSSSTACCGSSGGRQRGQAPGRLPGDHPQAVEKVEERYIRQTGGRGQYGHVVISLEPTGPGGGYEFIDKISGGVIPKEYIPAVDAGIQEALTTGVLAGYPTVDVRVPHLRLVPRRRLLGDGLQDRRLHGGERSGPEGGPGHAGAGDGRRGGDARGLHGRRHR